MLDILNSCARTLVLYPWIDLSPLLHAYASNFDALFVCLFAFFLNKKKIRIIQKLYVFVYIGTYVPWMAFETKFLNFVSLVAWMSIFMHN